MVNRDRPEAKGQVDKVHSNLKHVVEHDEYAKIECSSSDFISDIIHQNHGEPITTRPAIFI